MARCYTAAMPGRSDVSPPNLTQSPLPIKVLAFYKFAELPDCPAIQPELALFC